MKLPDSERTRPSRSMMNNISESKTRMPRDCCSRTSLVNPSVSRAEMRAESSWLSLIANRELLSWTNRFAIRLESSFEPAVSGSLSESTLCGKSNLSSQVSTTSSIRDLTASAGFLLSSFNLCLPGTRSSLASKFGSGSKCDC